MPATEFTPLASLIGGCLIGFSAVLLMATHGRIAGVSTIASHLLPPWTDSNLFGRLLFIIGLVLAPLLYANILGHWSTMTVTSNIPLLIVAGVLVGFGSVLGNGCTSGHGICGLSRLSRRSFVAVAVFMATAMVTVFVVRHIL